MLKLFVILSVFFVVTIAAPYQELPDKPGYVPVYIREGNTPLSEVNPKLVEAFHENEESNQPQLKNEAVKEDHETDKAQEPAKEEQKDEEETNVKPEVINESVDTAHVEEEEHKEEGKEEAVSDIAEFTSDDIKILADDKTDN